MSTKKIKEVSLYDALRTMKPGMARRAAILQAMNSAYLSCKNGSATAIYQIVVNCKWQLQLKKDLDLQYLIKKGFLKQYRECGRGYIKKPQGGFESSRKGKYSTKRQTYLILTQKGLNTMS